MSKAELQSYFDVYQVTLFAQSLMRQIVNAPVTIICRCDVDKYGTVIPENCLNRKKSSLKQRKHRESMHKKSKNSNLLVVYYIAELGATVLHDRRVLKIDATASFSRTRSRNPQTIGPAVTEAVNCVWRNTLLCYWRVIITKT